MVQMMMVFLIGLLHEATHAADVLAAQETKATLVC